MILANTLLAVVTFRDDLFYPVSIPALGVFIKKGVPHPKGQNVLWVRAERDGFVKSKSKRKFDPKEPNDLLTVAPDLRSFITNPSRLISSIPKLIKSSPIDTTDKEVELVPEVYLDEKRPSISKITTNLDQTVRELISNLISAKHEEDFLSSVFNKTFFDKTSPIKGAHYTEMPISDIFMAPIKTGDIHVSRNMDDGSVPLISTSYINYGVEKMIDASPEQTYKNAITIASDGTPLTAFYHYYSFAAKDNVMICFPKEPYRFTTLLYITSQINGLQWRFSYGRKCYLNKVHKVKVFMPIINKRIHEDYIEYLVKQLSSWNMLLKLFSKK